MKEIKKWDESVETVRSIGKVTFWDNERDCFVTIDNNENVTYWDIEEED